VKRATYVMSNSGTLKELRSESEALFLKLQNSSRLLAAKAKH
jgi:hypothetical protein